MHPAMAAHGAPRRVLVLGGGDGLAVREILKYPSVEQVTLVELDPHMTELFSDHAAAARAQRRLAALAEGARSSTPTPSPGSSSTTRSSTSIVVDFPDPTNFSIGKLYTNELLRAARPAPVGERLRGGADDLAADRAQELLDRRDARSRRSGSTATPYHAHVPSFGEWGFVLASRRPYPACPPPCPRACASSTLARPAAAVRLSARHGARAGRGEPALEPGAGADLRGRVGQGAAMSSTGAADPARRPRRRLGGGAGACSPAASAAAPAIDGGWVGARRRARPPAARRRAGRQVRRRRRRQHASAPARSSSAAASPGWPRRARCCAPASTTCALLELEDTAGGNSRGHALGGMRCPLGAHYLPVPGDERRRGDRAARGARPAPDRARPPVYDERMLCHSPQERLFIDGAWHDGLLPPLEALPAASAPRRWPRTAPSAPRSASSAAPSAFAIPTQRSRWSPALAALDATTFAAWLDAQRPRRPGPALVPRLLLPRRLRRRRRARSRPGPGCTTSPAGTAFTRRATTTAAADGGDGVLTWPEGNAWLAERLAAPLGERLQTGRVALRVARRHAMRSRSTPGTSRPGASSAGPRRACVVATPLFVAARLLESPPPALLAAAAAMRHAPWLVANLQLAARARRPAGRAALVGQRALRQRRPRLCRRDAPEHAARSPGRPCSPPTGRSAATARPSSRRSARAC